jgi:hypothetical protein
MKFVKAVLKTRAVQTLRDCRTASNCAKPLECGAFTAVFSGRRDGRGGVSAERRHLKKSGKFAAVCRHAVTEPEKRPPTP